MKLMNRKGMLALSVLALATLLILPACGTPAATATSVPAATVAPTAAPAATVAPTTAPAATVAPTTAPAATTASSAGSADSIDGHWEGSLVAGGQTIGTNFDFKTVNGEIQGTIDIPTQSVKAMKVSNISFVAPKVHFEAFPAPQTATWDGELAADGTLAGKFSQSGFDGTFSLKRVEVQAVVLPYKAEEVTFKNGDITLAGTLTLPEGAGPFPALVLITGSGPQNRDELVAGFPVFGTLADALTRKGYAVLRYDDRGIGGSTGSTIDSTSADFAGDAKAGVALLKTRKEIDPAKIGLLGHSEGGLIAPMVAADSKDVAFIILLSGPSVSGEQVLKQQLQDILKANGATQQQTDDAAANQQRSIDAVKTGQGWEALQADWEKQLRADIEAATPEQKAQIGDVDKFVKQQVDAQRAGFDNAWFKFFITYDPATALSKVTVPVLALFGGKDTQVSVGQNRAPLEKALEQAGNKDVTVKVFPDANHLYQLATTGGTNEYATLKPEFAPGVLDAITEWLAAHTK